MNHFRNNKKHRGRGQKAHFQVKSLPVSPSPYQSVLKTHVEHGDYRFFCTSELNSLHEEQQGWIKTDLGVHGNQCGHVLPTSLVDLLDAGDREANEQGDHEEPDENSEIDSFKKSASSLTSLNLIHTPKMPT